MTWVLCALAFATGQRLDGTERRAVAVGASVAAGLAGAWAVAEALGWEPVALTGSGDRPVGPLGSSAYLGAAMVLLGPAAIGLALRRRNAPAAVAAGLERGGPRAVRGTGRMGRGPGGGGGDRHPAPPVPAPDGWAGGGDPRGQWWPSPSLPAWEGGSPTCSTTGTGACGAGSTSGGWPPG